MIDYQIFSLLKKEYQNTSTVGVKRDISATE